MAVRLMTAIAGDQALRNLRYALLLAVMLAKTVSPASAQDADETYTATVKVDATAESAGAAREAARIDGQKAGPHGPHRTPVRLD